MRIRNLALKPRGFKSFEENPAGFTYTAGQDDDFTAKIAKVAKKVNGIFTAEDTVFAENGITDFLFF